MAQDKPEEDAAPGAVGPGTTQGLPPTADAPLVPVIHSTSSAPVLPTAATTSSGKTVTLSEEAFNAMMERMAKIEEEQRLSSLVEDKTKLQRIEEMRRAGKLVKSVKIRSVENKFVIGWKMIDDEVYMSEGKLIEKQNVEVWYEDDTKEVMALRKWATAPLYLEFEVIKEEKDMDGDIYFTIRNDAGKEVKINVKYVN